MDGQSNLHSMQHQLNRVMAALVLASFILVSCSSSTMITSNPTGAKLFINDMAVGTTPYTYSDTKIVGTTNYVRLEAEGYETLRTSFSRNEDVDVGAVIGGIFVLIPFLWTMKYQPMHHYELAPKKSGSDRDKD